jgi:hypothetical protein
MHIKTTINAPLGLPLLMDETHLRIPTTRAQGSSHHAFTSYIYTTDLRSTQKRELAMQINKRARGCVCSHRRWLVRRARLRQEQQQAAGYHDPRRGRGLGGVGGVLFVLCRRVPLRYAVHPRFQEDDGDGWRAGAPSSSSSSMVWWSSSSCWCKEIDRRRVRAGCSGALPGSAAAGCSLC